MSQQPRNTAADQPPSELWSAKQGNGHSTAVPSPEPRPESQPQRRLESDSDDIEAILESAALSSRRRWPALLLGLAAGAAGAVAVLTYLDGRDESQAIEQEQVALATAPVEQRDLLEEIEWAGTLGYGLPVDVAGSGGVVTSVVPTGTEVGRGDVVATVDDAPVVVLFGDTPMWRTLSDGTEGRDVLQLEANLAALGYDPDGTVDIDEVFTANTEAMVERWQTDLGQLDPTGVVGQGDVIIIEGPSAVTATAEVGSAAGPGLATLAPRRTTTDVVASIDGVISGMASVGTPAQPGTVLYTLDDEPVVVVDPDDPVAAALVSATYTTTELEQALADAGYDPDDEMTVDGAVTDATTAAIERWQTAAGLPVTGRSEPGYYTVIPAGEVIDEHLVDAEATLTGGGPVMTTSVSRLSVEVVVDVAEADEFETGQTVTIELADESTVDGVVTEIGSVTQADSPQGDPTVTITIGVASTDDQSLVEGPVTVVSIGQQIDGAVVVPTRALVALAEGGFAVERVADDGSTSLVAVELGVFDDGVVEVVTPEGEPPTLAPGDELVVPQ